MVITYNLHVVWAKNHFVYPWFEKYHLTHLWYIFVNLRNPPQAQPLQKHLLTPKHNITQPVARSLCFSWFWVFGEGENTSFATSKLGKIVSVKKIKVFVFVLDLGFQILFKCQLSVWNSKFVLFRNRVLLICLR